MLKGEYNHTIDAKGRVTIPAKFRSELGDSFVVTRGLGDCLTAYSVEKWQEIEERLAAIPLTNRAGLKLKRRLLGNAIDCEVDKMGRILITQTLREKADLEKDVALIGMGDRIELWDKAAWDAYNSEDSYEDMTDEELESLAGFGL